MIKCPNQTRYYKGDRAQTSFFMLLSVQLTYFASDGGNSTPSLLLLALFLILCKTTVKIESRFARMSVHVLVRAARASASRPSVAYEMNGHLRTTVLGARQYTHTTGKKPVYVCVSLDCSANRCCAAEKRTPCTQTLLSSNEQRHSEITDCRRDKIAASQRRLVLWLPSE